jgi:hypothetical protein
VEEEEEGGGGGSTRRKGWRGIDEAGRWRGGGGHVDVAVPVF